MFDGSGLVDPFEKNDGSHNTWVSVMGVKVFGGKLDWLLYSADTLTCIAKRVYPTQTAIARGLHSALLNLADAPAHVEDARAVAMLRAHGETEAPMTQRGR